MVGVPEGDALGQVEGREDGDTEGLREGVQDGCDEGRSDGLTEGLEDGCEEGANDGRLEGEEEGLSLGLIFSSRNLANDSEEPPGLTCHANRALPRARVKRKKTRQRATWIRRDNIMVDTFKMQLCGHNDER